MHQTQKLRVNLRHKFQMANRTVLLGKAGCFADRLLLFACISCRMSLQNYLVELLAEKGHWLAERNIDRVEVGMGFNRRTMKEMVAKQSFIAFLDKRQRSLQRDDDNLFSAVGGLFGWGKR